VMTAKLSGSVAFFGSVLDNVKDALCWDYVRPSLYSVVSAPRPACIIVKIVNINVTYEKIGPKILFQLELQNIQCNKYLLFKVISYICNGKSAPLYRHWGSVQAVQPIGEVEV
jgi:nucleoside recognition membrane protein YjiH